MYIAKPIISKCSTGDISRSLELGIYMTEYSLCVRYVPFSWHFCGLPEGVPIILLTIASQRFESWTSAEHLFEGLQCLGEENFPHSTWVVRVTRRGARHVVFKWPPATWLVIQYVTQLESQIGETRCVHKRVVNSRNIIHEYPWVDLSFKIIKSVNFRKFWNSCQLQFK